MKNVNERTIAQITQVLKRPTLDQETRRVLTYIKGQISDKGIDARPEHDKSITHLIAVANERFRRLEQSTRKIKEVA